MKGSLLDPCGRFLPALVVHDLKDRMRGRRRRADARWGCIRRPDAPGRLVWIAAGATRSSIRLGIELTRALVASRSDISALLTYEAEYPELLAPLAATPRTRCDFGPADYIGAVQGMRRRLLPLGIVVAGMAPRQNLRTLCEASRHALLVAPPARVDARFERIYPSLEAPYASARCAPVADLKVLWHPAGEGGEARSRGSATGTGRDLWWWHGSDPVYARRLAALFRGHLPRHRLGIAGPAAGVLAGESDGRMRSSEAPERHSQDGALIFADAPDWLEHSAACTLGVHFAAMEEEALWQAAANAAALSAGSSERIASAALAAAVTRIDDENDLITAWKRMSTGRELHAAAAGATRRAHATEWQRAAANAAELIARVQRWR
jgi:hypothetical protein